VRATVTTGGGRLHYRFSGLTTGHVYQLGATAHDPSCGGLRLTAPHQGIFVAGTTPSPDLGVVVPPRIDVPSSVRQPTAGNKPVIHWRGGAGITGGAWQLSVGDAATGCADSAGVVASGDLKGSSGSFQIDPTAAFATTKLTKVALSSPGAPVIVGGQPFVFTGALHLRVIAKDDKGTCTGVASPPVDVPVVGDGVPQEGATQLEIYDHPGLETETYGTCDVCQAGHYNTYLWKTHSDVDWLADGKGLRFFHWTSTAPQAVSGTWQLTASEFTAACDPPGLIASGAVALATGPIVPDTFAQPPLFTIDFNALAKDRGFDPAATYQIRVVPRTVAGGCAGPPSLPVTISYQPTPPPAQVSFPTPNPPPKLANVTTAITAFQPLRGEAPTPPYCFVALRAHEVPNLDVGNLDALTKDIVGLITVGAGGHVNAGQEVCYTPSEPDKTFWDYVGDVIDVVIDVVSFPSKVYELYQQILPQIIGDLIPGCDDTCKGYLLTAEKIGLAAIGLPPSLPDASKLVHNGEDYLIDEAAEESGVPPEVIRVAYDKGKAAVIDHLASVSSSSSGFSCDWCAFDNGVRAPGVTVTLSRPADDDPALPVPNRVCVTNTYSANNAPDAAAFYLAAPLYWGSCATLPKSFPPGSTLSIPMALTANLDKILAKEVAGDSGSQIVHSDAEYRLMAFDLWQGQQQHTPKLGFRADTQTTYDAGPSFGNRSAAGGLSVVTVDGF
jgi:hypothetical protein